MYYDVNIFKHNKKANETLIDSYIIDRTISFPNEDLIINDDDTVNMLSKKLCVLFNLTNIYIWTTYETSNIHILYDFIDNVFKLGDKTDYFYFKNCVENYFENIKLSINETNYYINKDDAFKILTKNNKKFVITMPLQFKYTINNFFEPLIYNPNRFNLLNNDFKGFNLNNHNYNTIEYILSNVLEGSIKHTVNKNKIKLNIISETEIKNNLMKEFFFPLKESLLNDNIINFINNIKDIEEFVYNYKFTNKFIEKFYISLFHCKFKCKILNNKNSLFDIFNNISTSNLIPFMKLKTTSDIYYKIDKNNLNIENINNWTTFTFNKNNFKYVNFRIRPINKNRENVATTSKEEIQSDYSEHYYSITIYEDLSVILRVSSGIDEKNNINKINSFLDTLPSILNIQIISNINVLEINTYNYLEILNKNLNSKNIENIISNKFYPYFNIMNVTDNMIQLQYKKVNNYNKHDNISNFLTKNFNIGKLNLIDLIVKKFSLPKDEATQEYQKWANKTKLELKIDNKKPNIKLKNDNIIDISFKISGNVLKYNIKGLKNIKTQERITNLMKIILDYNDEKKKGKINITIDKKDNVNNYNIDDLDELLLDSSDNNSLSISDLDNLNTSFIDDEDTINLDDLIIEKDTVNKNNSSPNSNITNTVANRKIFKQSEVLDSLKEADLKLFNYSKGQGKKRIDYPSACQWTDKRMPIVINEKEKKNIDENFPGSYANYVKTGSTKELANKNYYICPAVWCPISKVSLSAEQYLKYNNKCPYPDIKETPVLLDKYWGPDFLTKPRFVGYLNYSYHPESYCLPCCFKSNQTKKINQSPCIDNVKEKEKEKEPIIDKKESSVNKYTKNEFNYPLNPLNKGMIPHGLLSLFNNNKNYVRMGIEHQKHSFISAFIYLTSNEKSVKTVDTFINEIYNNIPMETYASLENGKILRNFINGNIEANQEIDRIIKSKKSFIKKFNLGFNTSPITSFIIYNSYINFMNTLKDDNIIKDHYLMLDLVNNEHTIINTNKLQIIIFELNLSTNDIILLCPPNRLNKDTSQKYSFMVKILNYYEPIIYFDNSRNIIKYFDYTDVKKIIDIYYNNCLKIDKNIDFIKDKIILKLKTMGYEIKFYVINYDYKIRGYILNNNLYIPLKHRYDLFNIYNIPLIYYNKILDYKYEYNKIEFKSILKALGEIDKFYTDYSLLRERNINPTSNTNTIKAYMFKDRNIIPFNITENDGAYFNLFKKDLEIFINKKIEDKRVTFMNKIKENDKNFNRILKIILNYIQNNETIKREINFILNPYNPFPLKYKRIKINELIKNFNIEINKEFISKIIENILLKGLDYNDTKFKLNKNEILLNQHEINSGKIKEVIELEKNPYKIIINKITELTDNIIFEELNNDYTNNFKSLYENKEIVSLPIKYIKLLPDFNVVDNNVEYNNSYIYNLFNIIINYDINDIKKIIKNNITKDYDTENINEFLINPSYKELYKVSTLTNALEAVDNPVYYPSVYEIKILSHLAKVNIVIIGRKTKANPDSIQVFDNNSDNIFILKHQYDRIKKIDIYELIIKSFYSVKTKEDEIKVLINKTDIIDTQFRKTIENKLKTFFIKIKT